MNNFKLTGSLVAFLLLVSNSFAETCTYDADANSLKVDWTAYKTMQKVGVGGSFTEVNLEGDLSKKSLAALLNQMDADINVDDASKLSTGNPGRDATILQNFFAHFKPKAAFKGKLRNAKGTDEAGELNLVLTMNKKTLAVPMKYTRSAQGQTMIKGAIDLKDFALDGALAKLNKACEVLHKGPDGVSKTWPQVEISIQANIAKNCK